MTRKRIFLFTVVLAQAVALPTQGAKLLAFFDFNDDSNPIEAIELSGNASNATLVGAAAFTPDLGGVTATAGDRALDLGGVNDGSGAVVTEGKHLESANLNNAMAISFWQNRTTLGNSSSFWVIATSASNNQRGFQGHASWGNETVYFDHSGCCNAPNRISGAPNSVVNGIWQHWVFQKDAAGNKEVWLNGAILLGPTAGAAPLLPLSGRFIIGAEGTGITNSFSGLIDDFAIYNDSLTPAEISDLALNGLQPDDIAAPPLDTDGDGIPDFWETANGLNPADPADGNGDGDNDGLTTFEEYKLCTDFTNPDTDGDGANDGDEDTAGTNPLNPDTDGDGLNDGDEATAGTDPFNVDSDGDLMFDGFEVNGGLNPLEDGTIGETSPGLKDGPDGYDGDPDGDTIINGDEEFFGTLPNNADTDGDTLADNVETNFGFYNGPTDTGTDPTNPDTDGDGLGDEVENPDLPFVDATQPGTDPNVPDSDFDGFPDGFEISNGSDPTDFNSIPAPGPLAILAHWDFNDVADPANALDVENGHVGLVQNGATYTADMAGRTGAAGDYAMDFGATTGAQTVRVTNASFLNPATAFDEITISFWQKLSNTANNSAFWAHSPSSSGTQRGIQAHVPHGGIIYYDSAGCCGGGQRISLSAAGVDFLNWRHFAIVKNGDAKEIWVDGVLFHSGTGSAPLPTDFTELFIGSSNGPGASIQGIQDDFALFSRALSSAQIQALASGLTPQELLTSAGDSDFDGMPDLYEDQNGLDKNDPDDAALDADSDGSNNLAEFQNGTDPQNPDTDGDGLNDGDEAGAGTDPLDPDSDGDGRTDNDELNGVPMTNPLNPDSDGDGMPDGFEVAGGLDPNDPTGDNGINGDPDGDGSDNGDEEIFGTDPTNPDTDGDSLLDGVETNFGSYFDETDTGTDPLNPDSDGDGLGDGVEVPNLPFVDASQPGTDPNFADTDFDGFPDGFEIARGTDPTDFNSFPTPGPLELLAYWEFNDIGDPANAVDSINSHTGSVLGGAAYTADTGGRSGTPGDYGMDFGTTSALQTVEVADADFINGATVFDEITITFWQKLSNVANTSSFWARSSSGAGTDAARGLQAHVPWGDGTIYFDTAGCCGPPQRLSGPSPAGIDDAQWHHFAFVKNGDLKEVWVDGVLLLTQGGADRLATDIDLFSLGSNHLAGNSLQGQLDDFAIFSRSLTPEQIGRLAAGEAAPAILSPPSSIAFTDISVDPGNGQASITWTSEPGKTYAIYTSTTLVGDPATTWQQLTDDWLSGGGTTTYLDTISAAGPVRFYYVIQNP